MEEAAMCKKRKEREKVKKNTKRNETQAGTGNGASERKLCTEIAFVARLDCCHEKPVWKSKLPNGLLLLLLLLVSRCEVGVAGGRAGWQHGAGLHLKATRQNAAGQRANVWVNKWVPASIKGSNDTWPEGGRGGGGERKACCMCVCVCEHNACHSVLLY